MNVKEISYSFINCYCKGASGHIQGYLDLHGLAKVFEGTSTPASMTSVLACQVFGFAWVSRVVDAKISCGCKGFRAALGFSVP